MTRGAIQPEPNRLPASLHDCVFCDPIRIPFAATCGCQRDSEHCLRTPCSSLAHDTELERTDQDLLTLDCFNDGDEENDSRERYTELFEPLEDALAVFEPAKRPFNPVPMLAGVAIEIPFRLPFHHVVSDVQDHMKNVRNRAAPLRLWNPMPTAAVGAT